MSKRYYHKPAKSPSHLHNASPLPAFLPVGPVGERPLRLVRRPLPRDQRWPFKDYPMEMPPLPQDRSI